jgi:hypothetical protein
MAIVNLGTKETTSAFGAECSNFNFEVASHTNKLNAPSVLDVIFKPVHPRIVTKVPQFYVKYFA